MKKFSILIVCLCAGMTFVCQAQDTQSTANVGGDTSSLQRRPRDWDEPIPGPIPHRLGGFDVDGDDSGDPHGSVGTSLDGLIKGNVRPDGTGGDAPSLQRRPRDWDEPIPGPFPHRLGDLDVGDDSSSLDGLEKGTVRPGSEPNVDIDGTYGTNRPREFDEPIVPIRPGSPAQEMDGISLVTGMIDSLLSGSTDVPDLNGGGKADISDVTALIDSLLTRK